MGAGFHMTLLAMLLAIDTANIIGQGFFLVMFGDLEMDYINPIDLCNKLNRLVLPEAAVQALGTFFALLAGEWILFLMMLPVTVHNVFKIYTNQYLLDATEIFKTLSKQKQNSFAKVIWQVVIMFYLIFRVVVSIIEWAE